MKSEKINYKIYDSQLLAVKTIANNIINAILEKQKLNQHLVLGLATGNTPILLYQEIVSRYKAEKLSFKNVVCFNLDEYYPIAKEAPQSYWAFMHHHLFNHVDIPAENINIPDGKHPKEHIKIYCQEYDQKIKQYGGIDIQILGIGNNGHIGFNEPGSSFYSRTRMIHLEYDTMFINSADFSSLKSMPQFALTAGIATILEAKKIILMAWGSRKAKVIAQAVEDSITEALPASILQTHANCTFYLDKFASSELSSIKRPWLTKSVQWDKAMIKKAVIDLCFLLKKPILSLTTQDYLENGLSELIVELGTEAYQLNLEVFYQLRDAITGWPGGKDTTLPNHPERSHPYPKKIIIFSPHPDDDIISMGGTFIRLHQQGHDVHTAYQVSGNIAVHDDFVLRSLELINDYNKLFGNNNQQNEATYKAQTNFIKSKSDTQFDSSEILKIKGIIRKSEALSTCRYVGIPDKNVHFLNLPFYETGKIEKNAPTQADIEITKKLLNDVQPQQVYCAGDLADPHGTHKVCLELVIKALKEIKQEEPEGWIKNCWLWLYKGAWQEWAIDEIEMAVPMSPEQVVQKRLGIYNHQSQKDIVPFMGSDSREFWQRAEDRNKDTAEQFALLGLTKYSAMEAFVKYNF